MGAFGGYAPFPIRLGQSATTLKHITDALNSGRGTGLDTTELGSNVWVENHAIARAISDVWQTNERLALQTDLSRTTMLERWEAFFGTLPKPQQSDAERRTVLRERQSRLGQPTNQQRLEDILAALIPTIPTSVIYQTVGYSGARSSSEGSWLMDADNGSTPPWLYGQPAENVLVEITFLSTGSFSTASFVLSYSTPSLGTQFVTYPSGVSASQPIAIGTTGLKLQPLSSITYPTNTHFHGEANPKAGWTSAADITVLTEKPSTMSDLDYYDGVTSIYEILDAILPAWACAHVVKDGSIAGAFVLDEPGNLDNQRLGV